MNELSLPTFNKGSQVIGEKRQTLAADLKKKYEAGTDLRELAEETGRSYGAIHRLLKESGVVFRRRGGYRRDSRKAASN
ncbi:helix-turn-helix domain-containing protein [Actinacidiphila sp. bgisy145]|uniref:helix-turn-helix domain-containing protein n=1 Tax=Actinacidiphila sp. bgisy145 TaxID=3413792 RepID=UPI003EBD6E11